MTVAAELSADARKSGENSTAPASASGIHAATPISHVPRKGDI
jgi:hypothetical protein